MKVIDKKTGKFLTDLEILSEINRDRSEEWTDYDLNDLKENFEETTDWIDRTYYDVQVNIEKETGKDRVL
jgi:hypothetical protein